MPRSNYYKAHMVRDGGVPREQVCPACKGSGEDARTEGADCLTCWGEGTIELDDAEVQPSY